MSRDLVRRTILTAKAANGVSDLINTAWDFRNIVICVSTSWNAELTLKCQWAIRSLNQTTTPDFSSVASSTNKWGYLWLVNLDDNSSIDWSTWIVFTWTDSVQLFEININLMDYISFEVSWYVAWAVTVDVLLSNNN